MRRSTSLVLPENQSEGRCSLTSRSTDA